MENNVLLESASIRYVIHVCSLVWAIRVIPNSLLLLLQVSAIAWNKYQRQMISAHGGPKHHMNVWNFPSLTKVAELHSHQERILHMCLSPKKTSVASASADETLRIWNVFPEPDLEASQKSYSEDSISALLQSFNHWTRSCNFIVFCVCKYTRFCWFIYF